jgi:hypothetical protein
LGTLTTLLSFAVIALYIYFLIRAERRSIATIVLAPDESTPDAV